MHYVMLYLEFIKLRLQAIAEFRKAFVIGAIAQIAAYGAEFMLIWIIVGQFRTINGWTSPEVLLLYGLNLGSYALAGFVFFNPATGLAEMIKNGTFDEVLTKPLSSLPYLVCREFNTGYFSHLLLSLAVIGISFRQLDYRLSAGSLFFLILVLLGGALIQGAGLLLTSVPAFWIVENRGLRDILFFQVKNFIRYPISIYSGFIQIVLTLILPYAFLNFYPAQYFLDKRVFLMFHPLFQYATPLVGLLLFLVACLFWQIGVNNYKSTGS